MPFCLACSWHGKYRYANGRGFTEQESAEVSVVKGHEGHMLPQKWHYFIWTTFIEGPKI
jgi:hypothetical protein